jgi:transcriptional regulator with XRE-family HTH domain
VTTTDEQDDVMATLRVKVFIGRKKAGLTQRACAEKMGVPENSWSLAESGNTRVTLARLIQMFLVVYPKAGAEATRLMARFGSPVRRRRRKPTRRSSKH